MTGPRRLDDEALDLIPVVGAAGSDPKREARSATSEADPSRTQSRREPTTADPAG